MYTGTDGVWVTLYANVTFRDPITGETFTSGERQLGRVLVMKKCWGTAGSAPLTVPDIRNWLVPGNIGFFNTPELNLRTYIFDHEEAPGGGTNRVASVSIEETSTRTLLSTSHVAATGTTETTRWNEHHFPWKVRDTWCARFPTDPLCGGSCTPGSSACPHNATFTFVVTATNAAGRAFYRIYQISAHR
jgi:hypothetical protein